MHIVTVKFRTCYLMIIIMAVIVASFLMISSPLLAAQQSAILSGTENLPAGSQQEGLRTENKGDFEAAVRHFGKTDSTAEALGEAIKCLKTVEIQDYFQDDCVAAYLSQSPHLEAMTVTTAIVYPIVLPDRLEILEINR